MEVKNLKMMYPSNLNNLAGNPEFAEIEKELKQALMAELKKSEDPRVAGPDKEIFDSCKRDMHIREFPRQRVSIDFLS